MRFALLGNDNDGVALARALLDAGHRLLYVTAAPRQQPWPADVQRQADVEEILADPNVEAVLVAGAISERTAQVRRALQSERAIFCLHPIETRPEAAYEAGMLQQDTRQLLLPLMPEAFHPAVLRLRSLLGAGAALGELRLLEVEQHSAGEVLLGTEDAPELPCVPHWNVLRYLGGEIAEVAALTPGELLLAGEPVVLSGCFQPLGMFQMTLVPTSRQASLRLRVTATVGDAELYYPLGAAGPCFLSWKAGDGAAHEENWDAWNPWPDLVPVMELALQRHGQKRRSEGPLSWQDAIRSLELDDAVRRSIQRRKTVALEYPEASEEVTFKGTMTLVGCALLWVIIFLAILSRWVPEIGLGVGPVLALFLGLQLLRWIIPPRDQEKTP